MIYQKFNFDGHCLKFYNNTPLRLLQKSSVNLKKEVNNSIYTLFCTLPLLFNRLVIHLLLIIVKQMSKNTQANINSCIEQLHVSMASTSSSIQSEIEKARINNGLVAIKQGQAQGIQQVDNSALRARILNWFKEKKILRGHPEALSEQLSCGNLKKTASLQEKPMTGNSQLIHRRLKEKLTSNG